MQELASNNELDQIDASDSYKLYRDKMKMATKMDPLRQLVKTK
jgi:hypothetical protein